MVTSDKNICNWIKCANNGKCEPFNNNTTGFRCRCEFGFTGMLCDERLNITSEIENDNMNCDQICFIYFQRVSQILVEIMVIARSHSMVV